MEFLASKWMVVVYVIIVIIIILLLIGRKSVHSEILINATKEQVWSVLANTDQYDSWNTVINSLTGSLEEGGKVKFMFNQGEGKSYEISAVVRKIESPNLLNQFGGMTGIMTYDHKYILEDIDGGTKVTIHEEYRGIMVPFWNATPVQKAYDRLNQDIKTRVENLNR